MNPELRSQLRKYLSNEITLQEFRERFVEHWIDGLASRQATMILGEISDLDEGFCTEDQLRAYMLKTILPLDIETGTSNVPIYLAAITI